jgi:hypothetical protein
LADRIIAARPELGRITADAVKSLRPLAAALKHGKKYAFQNENSDYVIMSVLWRL